MAKHRARPTTGQRLTRVFAFLAFAVVFGTGLGWQSLHDAPKPESSASSTSVSADPTPEMTTVDGVTFGNCRLPGYRPDDIALTDDMLCYELTGVTEPVPDKVSRITLYDVLYGCQSHLSKFEPGILKCSKAQEV